MATATTALARHPTERSVAVVGAGISGLVAAHSLVACGLEVTVFDKARGPGGRTSTRRQEGFAFDHGAQYFTARDPRLRRYVDSWVADGVVARWDGRIAVVNGGWMKLEEGDVQRFVGVPKMSAVAGHLASDLDVAYGIRVAAVERQGGRWRLADDSGAGLGDFDAVVAAVPPAQAAPLLAGAPQLEDRARGVVMRPCWAVMAAFDRRLESSFDGAFVEDSPLSWIARNSSKPGRPEDECWVLHASPEWSERHLEDGAEKVGERLLGAFFEATELEPRKPRFVAAHRWRFSIAESPLDAGCLWDAERRLGAVGDWCSGSRVEGAFLSGLAVAGRILCLPDRRAAVRVQA